MVLIIEHIDVCCGAIAVDADDDSENDYTKLKCASLINLKKLKLQNTIK